MPLLKSVQLVVIDNVAAYHLQDLEKQEHSSINVEDFPNVMLPFESTFLEMRVRNREFQRFCDECGVLATMMDPSKLNLSELTPSSREFASSTFLNKDVCYIMNLYYFEYGRSFDKKPEWKGSFLVPVNAEGQIVPTTLEGKFPLAGSIYMPQDMPLPHGFKNLQEVQRVMMDMILFSFLHPCFLALSFMHCRNVSTLTEPPPAKLSKIHERRAGRPLLKYHVLQIDHMKQILEKEGHASSQGLKQALHICRGHFKRYGLDGKGLLFGKHAGTVWVPMHARGSAEEGIVVKDYDVK